MLLGRTLIDIIFVCRFRMRVHVFERIVEAIEGADPYFKQKEDAIGRLGLTGLQLQMSMSALLSQLLVRLSTIFVGLSQ